MPLSYQRIKNFINNSNIQYEPLTTNARTQSHICQGCRICFYVEFCCHTEKCDTGLCKKIALFTYYFCGVSIVDFEQVVSGWGRN